MYIEKIETPNDLKKLKKEELSELAFEIRDFLLNKISNSGGHLASNLGIVDLTLVLHYIFDSPKDSFIFDVGHQAYTHKIITGRKNKFQTLRSYGGLSGFPKRYESIHDVEETGHASTSLSFSYGLSSARKNLGIDGEVIAIIGDGAMTGGLALEAINNIAHTDTDIIIIVNNNEMSIGNNIGAISKSLNMKFNDKLVQDISIKIKDMVSALPFGMLANDFIKRLEGSVRSFVAPGIVFRELGFKYFGPVDGHNYNELFETFNKVKSIRGPRMVQVNTVKGKGYEIAEKNPAKFHGIGPFDIETGNLKHKGSRTFSMLAGECIMEAAKENDKVVAITAAMESGTGLSDFAKIFPDRFFDVGIAEAHATTFAVGLSESGLVPFLCLYSTFLQRAYDELIHDVAIMNANVKFMIDRAGLVPEDGDTHQGVFDVSFLRIIPNLTIMTPVGEKDFRDMVKAAISIDTPTVIRYNKSSLPCVKENIVPRNFEIGKSHIVREGSGGLIISYGSTLVTIENVIEDIKLDVTLLNLCTIKPLDTNTIIELSRRSNKILVIEESMKHGGIGSAILELLADNDIVKSVSIHALPDKFFEVASRDKLLELYGLDFNGIKEVLNKYFKSK